MSYIASIPAWIIAVSLIGYTAGIVTLGIAAHRATCMAYDAAAVVRRRYAVRRALRRADWGSCDGMSRRQVARLVDASWSIPARD